jgi:riboflavin kinase/FMN adenylyltransferase
LFALEPDYPDTPALEIIRHVDAIRSALHGGALSIGNFDGVHLGHAQIARRLAERSRQYGGPAIIFTFDPHPVQLLRPETVSPPLTWTDRKAALLAKQGVDVLIAYPTDMPLLELSPEEFFEVIVRQRLAAQALVEGENFFFGRNRTGDTTLLKQLSGEHGMDLDVVPAVHIDDELVSSSRIRQLISQGAVETAARLLTEPYRLRGMVSHGAGRGMKIGFPTANLEEIDTILPATGVYAGRAYVAEQCRPAAIHIGSNPTFADRRLKVEVHLLDYKESLYGTVVEVDFLSRLRDIESFAGAAELRQQLARDVAQAKTIAALAR